MDGNNSPIAVQATALLEEIMRDAGGVDDHEGFAEDGERNEVTW